MLLVYKYWFTLLIEFFSVNYEEFLRSGKGVMEEGIPVVLTNCDAFVDNIKSGIISSNHIEVVRKMMKGEVLFTNITVLSEAINWLIIKYTQSTRESRLLLISLSIDQKWLALTKKGRRNNYFYCCYIHCPGYIRISERTLETTFRKGTNKWYI